MSNIEVLHCLIVNVSARYRELWRCGLELAKKQKRSCSTIFLEECQSRRKGREIMDEHKEKEKNLKG